MLYTKKAKGFVEQIRKLLNYLREQKRSKKKVFEFFKHIAQYQQELEIISENLRVPKSNASFHVSIVSTFTRKFRKFYPMLLGVFIPQKSNFLRDVNICYILKILK
ncbi:MAG: hypothetical protein NZ516_02200 [Raineya sp.]|nr:hypothetical protein [Raineya sp.]